MRSPAFATLRTQSPCGRSGLPFRRSTLWLAGGFLLASVSVSAGGSHGARAFDGQVVRVVDGDTIRVLVGGREEIVRYIGMNAPELGHSTRREEPGARAAAEANRKL